MKMNINKLRSIILNWYQYNWKNGFNNYPWRFNNRTPYEILIAEILLQHTTAKALLQTKVYIKFLNKYPNFIKLKNAKKKDLIELLKPIGLYIQKSDRLIMMANYILNNFNGLIPNDKKKLLEIPGIGEYIANAILTFAYGYNEVPLDNNLKRIALNVWNIKNKKELISFYKNLAKSNPKIIYWAFFDIGRFHCRKPIPKCGGCPLKEFCKKF